MFKSMSGSYSMKGTTPAGVTRMKGSLTTNGNGPPPLSYPADPPDDENMNEIISGNVDLTVVLPDGTSYQKTVESNIPMMDLLINLAATNKFSPASHTLVVLTGDKWKNIDFKANRTVGFLAGDDQKVSVQIVKKKVEDKVRPKSTAQPFEMTYRFTVNLPHNQKQVLRISPKLSLAEVRSMVCNEKGFDPSRYIFLLPSNPTNALDDSTTVGDLKTSEINFVATSMIDAASSKSMPDLAYSAVMAGKEADAGGSKRASQGSDYMPSTGEKKAKKGFLSFLGKKDKKFKINEDLSSSTNSNRPRKTESFTERPKTMYGDSAELDHFNLRRTTGNLDAHRDFRKSTGTGLHSVSENISVKENVMSNSQSNTLQTTAADTLPKKSTKKRAAPPPPKVSKTSQPQQIQVEIEMKPKQADDTKIEDIQEVRVPLKKLHSRNSSDSSGYHELTLSGADSPDSKDDTLQGIDTSHSGEHFNGDSGIRDMSPMPRRSDQRGPRAVSSRDSSLDIDKSDLSLPGKKKKRAPLPPPGMSVSNETKTADTVEEQKNVEVDIKKEEEFAALQAMEEVTLKFTMEESDDDDDNNGMMMIENSSIHSEDIDVDISHRQRPATFVAPPPPSEPPPEDSEPVDINSVVNYVDKIDIGVGEDTTSSGAGSAKSSPASIHRRPDSRGSDSDSSVNTLEDLSLAFKQTIAMGEEAFGLDSDIDNDSIKEELQKAMPDFKEQISKLAGEESETAEASNRTDQGTESDSSVVIHDDDDADKDKVSEATSGRSATSGLSAMSGRSIEQNRESSEITYNFTIDAVPPGFQTETANAQDEELEEEEEEVEIITNEVIELTPAERPESMELGSPRRIPDLDSPKEHKVLSLPVREMFSNIPLDQSTPKVQAEIVEPVEVQVVEREPEPEIKKPEEKEEFVISLDELSNVNFSVGNPEEIKKKRQKKEKQTAPVKNLNDEFYDIDEPEDDVIDIKNVIVVDRRPDPEVIEDHEDDTNEVKTKCSELSFTPDSEHEAEHFMEEKSISMIALPAERTPIKTQPDNDDMEDADKTYASATKIVLSSNTSVASVPSQSTEVSPRKDESFESQPLLQYQQMQQQFTTWQTQLTQNQQLLANQYGTQPRGVDDASNLQFQQLQLQIQMQQQMLLQLQQSMQALALQNTLVSQQNQSVNQSIVIPQETVQTQSSAPTVQIFTKDNEKHRPENPPSAPPPPTTQVTPPQAPVAPPPPTVVATSKPKPSKADAKYTKPKQKKFDRPLDPREQLMLDIRSRGKAGLKKVPVKATHWHK